MSGPPPKLPGTRSSRKKPVSDWTSPALGGWQGRKPTAPVGLMPESAKTWKLWFASWWAACWDESDVPQVVLAIKLYDAVQRGDMASMPKFQSLADSLGITPKGRASLRWLPPKGEAETGPVAVPDDIAAKREARAARLA